MQFGTKNNFKITAAFYKAKNIKIIKGKNWKF